MLTKADFVPHTLLVQAGEASTRGSCTCGGWARDVDAETVTVTGKSREDVLRAAHEIHARGPTGL